MPALPPHLSERLSRPRWRRRLVVALLLGFVGLNGVAYAFAWAMTHYQVASPGTPDFEQLSDWQKIGCFATNFALPRPSCSRTPGHWANGYSTLHFAGAHGLDLEAWRVPGEAGHPVVLLFHGYNASKSSLVSSARAFHELGCETWLVDFHGSGNSAGSNSSIGYYEADDVAATIQQAVDHEAMRRPLVLYGVSMGASAVLCAVHRFEIHPDALILECPFDRLVTTVGNRCNMLGLPAFPAADLLVFWGGVQGKFNGFTYNPVNYAREVRCPTLLMQGDQDRRVGFDHAKEIAAALGEHCTFKVFPGAGHIVLIGRSEPEWRTAVTAFFDANQLTPTAAVAASPAR
jgi:hypothetical protein